MKILQFKCSYVQAQAELYRDGLFIVPVKITEENAHPLICIKGKCDSLTILQKADGQEWIILLSINQMAHFNLILGNEFNRPSTLQKAGTSKVTIGMSTDINVEDSQRKASSALKNA